MDGSLVLEVILKNTKEWWSIHLFPGLRFLCKNFWKEEIAWFGCALIPFYRQEEGLKMLDRREQFDKLYQHRYRFSTNYTNHHCPNLYHRKITSFYFADCYGDPMNALYICPSGIKLILNNDDSVFLCCSTYDNCHNYDNIYIKLFPEYDYQYLSNIKGKLLRGLMISESHPKGTVFLETCCGLQFPFYIDATRGWLKIRYDPKNPISKGYESNIY